LPQRLLGTPEVQQPMIDRARLHLLDLGIGQKEMRGALGDIADDLDVDSDGFGIDDRRAVFAGVRERHVISGGAFSSDLLLRDAAERPLGSALLLRKAANDSELLDIEPRFRILDIEDDDGARVGSEDHGCTGTAGMNCESPLTSTTEAYAT